MDRIYEKCYRSLICYKEIDKVIWKDLLEVDVEDLELNISSKELILAAFAKFPLSIKKILEKYSSEEASSLIENNDEDFIKLIFTVLLMNGFLNGKLEQVKNDYFYEKLSEDDREIIQTLPKNCRDLVSCLLIESENKLTCLQDIFYLCRAHSYSYTEYQLAVDFEGVIDIVEREELKLKLNEGFELTSIDIDEVNAALNQFEREQETNYEIKCKYSIFLEDEIVLFILREDKRASIRKIDELLVDTSADWTVIRYCDSFKKVKVRSPLKKVGELSSKILSKFIEQDKFYYVPSDKKTSKYYLTKFFVKLVGSQIEHLKLLEFKVGQLRAPGGPSLILRRESDIEIKETLINLESNGFKMIKSIDDIDYIKFEFTDNSSTHIYQLKFISVAGTNSKFVELSGKGGSLNKRERLASLLEDLYIHVNEGRVR